LAKGTEVQRHTSEFSGQAAKVLPVLGCFFKTIGNLKKHLENGVDPNDPNISGFFGIKHHLLSRGNTTNLRARFGSIRIPGASPDKRLPNHSGETGGMETERPTS